MAEDHGGRKESKAPWYKLFTSFKVALDPKKMFLAGLGLLVMSAGWAALSIMFYNVSKMPVWKDYDPGNVDEAQRQVAWDDFRIDRRRWNLRHELAGPTPGTGDPIKYDLGDLAPTLKVYESLQAALDGTGPAPTDREGLKILQLVQAGIPKSSGRLRSLPWFENRGANPYLLVSETLKAQGSETRSTPWARGQFLQWFIGDQAPLLLEPIIKFLMPLVYFFEPGAGGFVNRSYLILVILWALATWGLFGGAITRMAALQFTRGERPGFFESVRFARGRLVSYFAAPVLPLVALGILAAVLWFFGLFHGWTFAVGDIVAALLWPVVLVVGLIMVVILVGLLGWPMMNATISTEGSDSFDALSRSYSYVYQAPWNYLFYCTVSILYGAVLVFFVGFMGSTLVYLGKWGVSHSPVMTQRDPTYLFAYAPTSFGWRDLLLHDANPSVVQTVRTPMPGGGEAVHYELNPDYAKTINLHNNIGAIIVTVWLYLFFLLIVGFGYSYFWTASTLIYLLMRNKVDDTDLEEVHLEEEEEILPRELKPATKPSTNPPGVTFTMVEAPQLRPSAPPEENGEK